MSFEDGMNETQRKHQYLTPGSYTLEVTKTLIRKHPTKGTDDCITEFRVVEEEDSEFDPGDIVSWYVTGSPKGREDVAHLWRLCVGAKEKISAEQVDLNKDVCKHILSEAQPLNGCKVKAAAHNITTRSGNPFTVVRFSKLS